MNCPEKSAVGQALEGEHLPGTPPSERRIKLNDAEAIRREMATVYREMRTGKVDCKDGTRLAFVLNMLRQAYETEIIEKRVQALEKELHHGEA